MARLGGDEYTVANCSAVIFLRSELSYSDGLEGMARLGGDEYAEALITSVGFLRRMQRGIPDFGARTVVFIPSHLFHPLHHCEKLAACGGAMGNAKREGRRSMIAAL